MREERVKLLKEPGGMESPLTEMRKAVDSIKLGLWGSGVQSRSCEDWKYPLGIQVVIARERTEYEERDMCRETPRERP